MITGLIVWFIIVIVHGLTRAYIKPEIKVEYVTTVKYLERKKEDMLELNFDYIINSRELQYMQPEDIVRKFFLRAFDELYNTIPKEYVSSRHYQTYDIRHDDLNIRNTLRILKPDPRFDVNEDIHQILKEHCRYYPKF